MNSNRLQCKYRYKMAIKSAISNLDKTFNDDLFDYFCSKDGVSFWRAWRKRYCSSSVKTSSVVNGKHGDSEICAEFTEHFQSVFTARCYASAVLAMGLCLSVSVRLSQVGVLLKRQNKGSHKQHHTIPQRL